MTYLDLNQYSVVGMSLVISWVMNIYLIGVLAPIFSRLLPLRLLQEWLLQQEHEEAMVIQTSLEEINAMLAGDLAR